MERNPKCNLCNLCESSKSEEGTLHICLWGEGNKRSPIMFVGESPSSEDLEQARPFVGAAGQLFTKSLRKIGYTRKDIYITNAVKCRPPQNKKPSKSQRQSCLPYLHSEIKKVNPKVIVALGATAFEALTGLTGIEKALGKFIEIKGNYQVYPIYHPAYILRYPEKQDMFEQELEKVLSFAFEDKEVVKVKKNYHVVDSYEKFTKWKSFLLQKKHLSIDSETTSVNFEEAKVLCISFSWEGHHAVTVPWNWKDSKTEKLVRKGLIEILHSSSQKIYQNGKYDIKVFSRISGIDLSKLLQTYYHDTLLAHHLINENSSHDLGTLAWLYTKDGGYDSKLEEHKDEVRKELGIKKEDLHYGMLDTSILYKYANGDADVTFQLFKIFDKELSTENLSQFFYKIVMPLSKVLLTMELNGIQIDVDYLSDLIKQVEKKKQELYSEFLDSKEVRKASKLLVQSASFSLEERYEGLLKSNKMSKKEYVSYHLNKLNTSFNPNSSKHLQLLFFDIIGLEPIEYTPTHAPKLDAASLQKFASECDLAKILLTYRNVEKFLNTFLQGVQKRISKDGRVRTTYLQFGTVTGRLSSTDPNMQNIPKPKEGSSLEFNYVTHSQVRRMFIASPGYTLVEADYSQAEFRIWAEYSRDENLLTDIRKGVDIHRKVAAACFDIPQKEVTSYQRSVAKTVVFGLMYGRGVGSLSAQLNISVEQAQSIIDFFFENYGQAKQWLYEKRKEAIRYGYSENLFGRRRHLPLLKDHLSHKDINSIEDEELKKKLFENLRFSVNAPIQSGAADMVGVALIRLHKRILKDKLPAKLLLQIHDAIVSEVRDDYIRQYCKILREEMLRPIGAMVTPMNCEIEIGKDWSNMESYVFTN